MPKRTKKNSNNCEEFLFQLKPLQNDCKFNQIITHSYCDSSKHKKFKCKTLQNNPVCLDCPVFNKDRNHATPSFILQSDKAEGDRLLYDHQKKMMGYSQQKSSLNLPKPKSKHSFCSVCRQVYEDYLIHIESDSHKKFIRSLNINRSILQLVEKFNPIEKSSLNFPQSNISTQQDNDDQIVESRPKKKVKTTEQNQKKNTQFYRSFPFNLQPNFDFQNANYFQYYPGYIPNQNYNCRYQFAGIPNLEINVNNFQSLIQTGFIVPVDISRLPEYFADFQRNFCPQFPFQNLIQYLPQNYGGFNNFGRIYPNFNNKFQSQKPFDLYPAMKTVEKKIWNPKLQSNVIVLDDDKNE